MVSPAITPASDEAPFDLDAVLAALRTVLPNGRPLALHEPLFAGNEWERVKECLDSRWVSSAGSHVDRFERMIADAAGVSHAIAVVNGTAALHLALRLAGVSAEDEVFVPALTFIATANAVSYCGAVPHFVDSCPSRLGMDPGKLERHLDEIAERRGGGVFNRFTGRRLAAIVPMHAFGHPVDMDGLAEVASRWNLPIVEDAAESLGSRYKGRPTGGLGLLGALSFNGNKIVTSGGGGAVLTNDPELARAARHLSTTAKQPHRWAYEHDAIGYNYRLPNLNAALGCAQLEQLDRFVAAKRRLAARYHAALSPVPGVSMVREPGDGTSNYWLNAVFTPDAAARDALLAATHAEGLLTRPCWGLAHRTPMYAACPRAALPAAEELEARLVCLPSSASLAAAGDSERHS